MSLNLYSEAWRYWVRGLKPSSDPDDPCGQIYNESPIFTFKDNSATGNGLTIEMGEQDGNASVSSVQLALVGGTHFMPDAMRRFPEGTEILEAFAEVSCSGLTRQYDRSTQPEYDCDMNLVTPGETESSTTVEALNYTVLGITDKDANFEIVGSVGPALNKQRVLDVTDLMRTIYEAGSKYRAFVTIALPDGLDLSGDVAPLLPGETAIRQRTVCTGLECEGSGFYEHYEWRRWTLSWTSINWGQLVMKIALPEEDRARDIIMPPWPSMAPVPA